VEGTTPNAGSGRIWRVTHAFLARRNVRNQ
jgi:hypothetical protein